MDGIFNVVSHKHVGFDDIEVHAFSTFAKAREYFDKCVSESLDFFHALSERNASMTLDISKFQTAFRIKDKQTGDLFETIEITYHEVDIY